MLTNEDIRMQLKDTRDIVRQRTAGVVHKMASAADDDVPYGADDNLDEDGGQGLTLVHFSAQRKHILWDTLAA
jgi:hypothetical protein